MMEDVVHIKKPPGQVLYEQWLSCWIPYTPPDESKPGEWDRISALDQAVWTLLAMDLGFGVPVPAVPVSLPEKGFFDEIREIQETRSHYGSPTPGHANYGLILTAILQNHYGIVLPHPVPSSVAQLCLVAVKLNRAARPVLHRDDFIDGSSYFELAYRARVEEAKGYEG